MEINFNENRQVWDEFISRSPHRSIFVYTKFLDSLQVKYDLITAYDKGKIVAGALVLFSDLGIPIKASYLFTLYQGILLSDNEQMEIHSRVIYEYKILEYFINRLIERYKRCSWCQSWRFKDLRCFQWYNYHESQKKKFKIDLYYTGILDLKNYNTFLDYISSIRTLRVRELTKAKKSLTIKSISDEVILDRLLDMTFERQGIERSAQESALVTSIVKSRK